MKILQIYNEQRGRFGGEMSVVDTTMRLLAQNGQEPRLAMKSSRVLEESIVKRMNAFWGGVYNVRSYYEMRSLLKKDKPDVVHVHSVYPMFSPSVLVACRHLRIPAVMTVHNWILTCPTWYHFSEGRACEQCVGGHEYRCVLKNCRSNILESCAYALRSAVARRFRLFHDNLSVLVVMTPFGKEKLLQAGFREEQIAVAPNPVSTQNIGSKNSDGKYVAFAGRVCLEKGINVFLAAAARLPDIPFKVAGDGPALAQMKTLATGNVTFLGRLESDELRSFYEESRALVVPSLCFEQFGMVAADAMAAGVPVIASNLGALPYVVDEGVTGSLFEPRNADDLARRVRHLWEAPQLCKRMGGAGRQKVLREYTETVYFQNLMSIYQTAIQRSRNGRSITPFVYNGKVITPSAYNGKVIAPLAREGKAITSLIQIDNAVARQTDAGNRIASAR